MGEQEQRWKSWGVGVYAGEVKYAVGLDCRECGWDVCWKGALEDFAEYIVGFSISPPFHNCMETDVGVLIVECPQCFSRFWFLVRQEAAKRLRLACSRWPKDEIMQATE